MTPITRALLVASLAGGLAIGGAACSEKGEDEISDTIDQGEDEVEQQIDEGAEEGEGGGG